MKAPTWAKIGLYYLLSGSFLLVRDIPPFRKLILPYLKRANSWLARFDCLQGCGPIRTYPVDVILQATYRCNLSCPMCFRQTMMADQFPALNALEYTPETRTCPSMK